VVARSTACMQAWGQVQFQCATWNAPAAGQELVVVALDDCNDSVDVTAALACPDRIEISYIDYGTCQPCDGKRSALRAFALPLDPRPVIAQGKHVIPPCLPPDLPVGDGGADGSTEADAASEAGAATAADAGCPGTRISADEAAAIYGAYVKGNNPDDNPQAVFTAEEKSVPGLWEDLRAQLFVGKVGVSDTTMGCAFVYRRCAITIPTYSCDWFGLLSSGVVKDGAFYYSWGAGSGVYRSIFGKLTPEGDGLAKLLSGEYFDTVTGGDTLVVSLADAQLAVYRATTLWSSFNDWSNPRYVGTLADLDGRLVVIGPDGRELPSLTP
jgi:hypothetical protein